VLIELKIGLSSSGGYAWTWVNWSTNWPT